MSPKHRKRPTVGFIALGCPKNVVDSERMLAEIAKAGFTITGETDNADVVVVNTCGFIAPAKAESLEAVSHAVTRKRAGAVKKVVVAGCLSERLGDSLFFEAEGIDAVVGLGERDNIARIIERVLRSEEKVACLGIGAQSIHDDRSRLLITAGHWAYLRISEGCNRRCSFCTIPSIRGPFRSKPMDLVLAEADELVSAGVVELNIIAQDTTSYGRDLKMKNGLAVLLSEMQQLPSLIWIRLMYMYPEDIDERLIETVAASDKVVHYCDVPVQHVSSRILRAMRRPGAKKRIGRLIEKLRETMPDIILRTTLITGFPGETDQEHRELCRFVEWAQFDALGCFKFYSEPGTEAARMDGQVPDRVKQERLDELMLTQQKIAFAANERRVGSRLTCLVDSAGGDATGVGRFYGQAPDIDSVCIIEQCSAEPGEFIEAEVVAAKDYDLVVRQVGAALRPH